ncbi:hypothetical protein EJ06DRAFT_557542 [Trichodelitschia bisporula]|uniref:F-box domain-containing protein n=1 Tax=Trichodelitschia bisporula TaxID=703511 RepID=A0A6G1HT57_9PEZI|nr:hypothetical protein EJ06DRAFT_557542 [Trichodelitschia bisporula]
MHEKPFEVPTVIASATTVNTASEPPKTIFRNSLHNLPDELVLIIAAQVPDQPTLLQLARSSIRLYRLVTPFLYRHFEHHLFSAPQRLHLFLRTLVHHPSILTHVSSLALRDPRPGAAFHDLESWSAWATGNYNPALPSRDHASFIRAAAPLLETQQHRARTKTALLTQEEAQAALLLTLTTHLTDLTLENPVAATERPRFVLDHLVLTLLHPVIKAGRALQALRRLKAVSTRMEGGQGGFRLSSIAPFFHLPRLEYVTGHVCFEPEDGHFVDFDCPAGTSSVSHIVFQRSSVCPRGMGQMVRACRGLRTFDCDWAGESVGWVEINFGDLKAALEQHKHTLERLRLDTRKHFDSWPERDDGLVLPLGRLDEFEELKVLEVPASALIGWDEHGVGGFPPLVDVLPPRIEELRLNEGAPGAQEAVVQLASRCLEYPSLRTVVICLSAGWEEGAEEMRGRLGWGNHGLEIWFEDGSEVDHFSSGGSDG